MVILHGLFGSSRNWQTIAGNLAQNHRILVPDLRNHGESPHSPFMDYPFLVADIAALLDQHKIDCATLLGHSMGGKIAMWLALTNPERVIQLIVVDIAPIKYKSGFESIINAMRKLPVADLKNRTEADRRLSTQLEESSLRQFLLQNLVYSDGQYRWRINLDSITTALPDLLDFSLADNVSPFQGKTLFVKGSDSDYINQTNRETISQFFPKSRIETISGAGHWLHAQHPQRFIDLVVDFLND